MFINRIAATALLLFAVSLIYAEDMTPEMILVKFEVAVQNITDYQCRIDEWCSNGSDYEKRIINYYFKKPGNIRTVFIEGNRPFDKGSVAVYTGGNNITGSKGGILSGAVMSLDKKAAMATTIRGIALDESDMPAILEKLRFHIKNSENSVAAQPGGIYRLTGIVKDPSKNGKVSREVIYMDSETSLPVKMEGFEGNNQVMFTVWSGYIVNAGLPDELFTMNFKLEKLKQMGIETLK
jgi:outer membrane lipoprotein-sorting protein